MRLFTTLATVLTLALPPAVTAFAPSEAQADHGGYHRTESRPSSAHSYDRPRLTPRGETGAQHDRRMQAQTASNRAAMNRLFSRGAPPSAIGTGPRDAAE